MVFITEHNFLHDYEEETENPYNLIFIFVKKGLLVEFQSLVNEIGKEVLHVRDEWGYTLAHWAALENRYELLSFLIQQKVDVNKSCYGTQGPKPIHWACRKGHVNIVDLLLRKGGSDVNIIDLKGITPLMVASMFGQTATTVFLLGMGAKHDLTDINGDSAMHWAAYKGYVAILHLLINAGADLRKRDNFGSTALHLACLCGSMDCVKVFCSMKKIDLEIRDKNSMTPLMLAEGHKHSEIAELLRNEIKKRRQGFKYVQDVWDTIWNGFGEKRSKGPMFLFIGSFLLWFYPTYLLRVVPLTWDALIGTHYCFIYWNSFMWLSWLFVKCKNPGYIRKNSKNYAAIVENANDHTVKKTLEHFSWAYLCHTCRCRRPLRAKHCSLCDRCVVCFDHHCSITNNCIGIRNRVWFVSFLLSLAVSSSIMMYFLISCISKEGFEVFYLLPLLECVTLVIFGYGHFFIAILHACMNITANEMMNYKRYPYLRDKRGRYCNWFSGGLLCNLYEFFTVYNISKEDRNKT